LLLVFVAQIPNLTYSYTKFFTDFLSSITIELGTETVNELIDENLVNELNRVANLNSIQSFRVFELFIKLGCVSRSNLDNVCERKFFLSEKIKSYLQNPNADVLAALNCIELLSYLVESEHGFEYCQYAGHLQILIDCLTNNSAFASFLVPSIVKLFAVIAKCRPSVLRLKYPKYFGYLFENALDDNLATNIEAINLAVETFSFLLDSNVIKKFFLENYEAEFTKFLEKLVQILRSSINDKLRANTLQCLAEISAADPSLLVN
jgi:hypothetical protein